MGKSVRGEKHRNIQKTPEKVQIVTDILGKVKE
jgi:hypothetical protein